MRITCICVVLCSLVLSTLAADEHRPKRKEERGKRQLEYPVSHHYSNMPTYRLERRISSGPQGSHPPQYYPRPYRKDNHNDDPLTENNHINQDDAERRGYIHIHRPPKIIERPVYIKEPEPIIEIIIKESNISLPTPPPPPPPPKKKKEQVQVFFVKYKKNPHGTGKDAIIYDKPVPAISPKLPEDDEEEQESFDEAPYNYHPEVATAPPPPSTTLRTFIKPESELYHSPSGVKVTFGKEGFDYEKRSSKPEDFVPPQSTQFPQGRQLTSFSNAYFKPPLAKPSSNFQSPHGLRSDLTRQRQTFRPPSFSSQNGFKQFSSQALPQQQVKFPHHGKPTQDFSPRFPQQTFPQQFSHSISHPPPTRFQSPHTRQPVPYKPFENFRPQPPPEFSQPSPPHHQQTIHFRPETHFSQNQQLPLPNTLSFPRFNPLPKQESQRNPQQVFQPQQHFDHQQQVSFQRPQVQQNVQNYHPIAHQPQQQIQVLRPRPPPIPHPLPNPQPPQNFYHNEHRFNVQQNQFSQPQNVAPLRQPPSNHIQSIVPAGGELIHSLPKFEQHISSLEPVSSPQQVFQQNSVPDQLQQKAIDQFSSQEQVSQDLNAQQQNHLEQQRRVLEEQQRQRHQEHLRQFYLQQQEQQQQQQTSHNNEERQVLIQSPSPSNVFQTTRNQFVSTTPKVSIQSSTSRSTTTSTTTEASAPSTTTKDPKILEAQLPDEVPEELRQQLLASGILNHADISVLDYDKVGDIPLSALPPDQLANFYNAGGASQIESGSNPVPTIVDKEGTPVAERLISSVDKYEADSTEIREVKVSPPNPQTTPSTVNMKVVHYDPDTDKGQQVQESYLRGEKAKQVSPVVLNDDSYTRYLPLKVNGSHFPIPDVPELKGKRISSVVVLAPVTYDFSSERTAREISRKSSDLDLIEGEALKALLANPTLENYRKFLERENMTKTDKQAVILLVTDSQESSAKDKEIFMYDVGTHTVSKLSGELSSAFVEAAEANSNDTVARTEDEAAASSNVVETRIPYGDEVDRRDAEETVLADLKDAASNKDELNIPIIDPMQEEDMETEASERLQSFVDISGHPLGDLSVSGSDFSHNYLGTGDKKTGLS